MPQAANDDHTADVATPDATTNPFTLFQQWYTGPESSNRPRPPHWRGYRMRPLYT